MLASRVAIIEERERACGVRFPASVREWFAIESAESLFYRKTNQDHLEELARLGDPRDTAQGCLKVATENQGVATWYVRLAEAMIRQCMSATTIGTTTCQKQIGGCPPARSPVSSLT